MAKRAVSSEVGRAPDPTEMSANESYAVAMRALKERHKEAKELLKQKLAEDLAAEQAEARRREERRNYLLGQALRRDQSEAAVALASGYMKRMTHPSDRKLFGLPPLPETADGSAESPVEELEKRDGDENDQGMETTPSMAETDGVLALSNVEEGQDRSEATEPPGTIALISEGHSGRNERGMEEADGDVPHGVGTDRADVPMPDLGERDAVASAGLGVEDRRADFDRNGRGDASSPSTTSFEDIDPSDGGTKVQATDLTAVEQASIDGSAGPSFFAPQIFLSTQALKEQIDQTGAKRMKSADRRWIATAVTPEQAASLTALKLRPYEPK